MGRKEDSQITQRVNRRMGLTQQDIFDFPTRPKNILWYLTHRFLFRGLRITRLEIWDALLKKYVNDPRNGVRQTPEARTSMRGNLTSQVFSEDEGMSIATAINSAVVAGAEEVEIVMIWKMPKSKRLWGKIRYPLTPDVVMGLTEEDEETKLISEISRYINTETETDDKLSTLVDRLKELKVKKSTEGENNG